jgi:hypothetical protein
MKIWEIKRIRPFPFSWDGEKYILSQESQQIEEGWEPFAAGDTPYGFCIVLRREVEIAWKIKKEGK